MNLFRKRKKKKPEVVEEPKLLVEPKEETEVIPEPEEDPRVKIPDGKKEVKE